MTALPALRVRDVVKDYVINWRGNRWRALDGVSFEVAPGTICALVGPNGAGKSTLLKLCAGLTAPTSGSVTIGGRDATDAASEQVGFLPEAGGLTAFQSAAAALETFARLSGRDAPDANAAALNALRRVGLEGVAQRRVGELSKGQRQRVGLAQALLDARPLLLLDEPASGLDPRALAELTTLLAAERAAGRTIVLSSHFLPQVEELCDQIILLERGRVLFAGTRHEAATRGGVDHLYLELTRT